MTMRNLRNWAFVGHRDSKGGPNFERPSGWRVRAMAGGKLCLFPVSKGTVRPSQWDGSENGAAIGK